MYIVQVRAHVKEEHVEEFRKACIENAKSSLKEPGIVRFDVLQQEDDPTCFILLETYLTAGDPPRHRETNHYKVWKDSVEPWMAEPRTKTVYANCFPDDKDWR
jgi:autoinducer 2-degrading protein